MELRRAELVIRGDRGRMQATVTASTGATVLVWHHFDSFYARRADTSDDPEICLGVDLFEVIAELAGLDLGHSDQAAEAVRLADDARRTLDGETAGGRRDGETAGGRGDAAGEDDDERERCYS
jgi:hypothetical protein